MATPKVIEALNEEISILEKQIKAPEPVPEQDGEGQTDSEPSVEQAEPVAQQKPKEEPREERKEAFSDDEAKWEHKYRRLQGKYDAEVPRLHGELRDLRAQLEHLQAAVAKPAPQPEPEKPSALVTETDVEAFGEDLIDLQRRVAREVAAEFSSELSKLRDENKQLREQVTQVQGASFETRLLQAVPDFAQINQDDRWVAWLNEFDPMIRAPRRTVAQAAYESGDVEGVKAYVEMFKSTLAPQTPAQTIDRQAELKRQVQPNRVSSQATGTAQAKVYSDADARRMFDRVTKLVTQGKYDEAAALEAEISTAYSEGRVLAR